MGKKSRKLSKAKQDCGDDLEDYAWLLKDKATSSVDAVGSSSNQAVSVEPSAAPLLQAVEASPLEVLTSPSVSCSLGLEDSVSKPISVDPVLASDEENEDADITVSPAVSPNEGTSGKDKSWASLFQLNRKLKDDLVLSDCVDNNPFISLLPDDVDVVQDKWGFGLIGYVAGKFPGKGAIDHCCKSWDVKVKLHFHSSGWLLFRFSSAGDRDSVLRNGPYYIFGRPLLLKIIPDVFDFNDHEISKVPVWVQLPNLPLEFWNTRALSKIASKIGSPKQADRLTIARERVSYARVLVEVDVTKELKEEVTIIAPNGKQILQHIRYEFVPKFCSSCRAIGHLSDRCPYSISGPTVPVKNRQQNHSRQKVAEKGASGERTPAFDICPPPVLQHSTQAPVEVAGGPGPISASTSAPAVTALADNLPDADGFVVYKKGKGKSKGKKNMDSVSVLPPSAPDSISSPPADGLLDTPGSAVPAICASLDAVDDLLITRKSKGKNKGKQPMVQNPVQPPAGPKQASRPKGIVISDGNPSTTVKSKGASPPISR